MDEVTSESFPMNPLRRALLIFLDPRPPWWASAVTCVILGILLIIGARFINPGPLQWLRVTLEVAGFILILNACLARFIRQLQINFHTQRLIRRGAGQCPECGYNLKGVASERCPECGIDIEAVTRESAQVVKPGS
jgi:hypothetical protein